MALSWCAADMLEAGKQFRRVNGHLHLPALRDALEREVSETVPPDMHSEPLSVAVLQVAEDEGCARDGGDAPRAEADTM